MVRSCCAIGCTYRFEKESGIKLYRFPANPERRRAWTVAIRRADADDLKKNWEPNQHSWLCSQHFVNGEFIYHIL